MNGASSARKSRVSRYAIVPSMAGASTSAQMNTARPRLACHQSSAVLPRPGGASRLAVNAAAPNRTALTTVREVYNTRRSGSSPDGVASSTNQATRQNSTTPITSAPWISRALIEGDTGAVRATSATRDPMEHRRQAGEQEQSDQIVLGYRSQRLLQPGQVG